MARSDEIASFTHCEEEASIASALVCVRLVSHLFYLELSPRESPSTSSRELHSARCSQYCVSPYTFLISCTAGEASSKYLYFTAPHSCNSRSASPLLSMTTGKDIYDPPLGVFLSKQPTVDLPSLLDEVNFPACRSLERRTSTYSPNATHSALSKKS